MTAQLVSFADAQRWLVSQGFEEGDIRSIQLLEYSWNTPVHHASKAGELNVVQWLCEHGAWQDLVKRNSSSCTPMLLSCRQGHLELCQWLYAAIERYHGPVAAADAIRKKNSCEDTPMHSACKEDGNLDVCKWLYSMGAAEDVNAVSRMGCTPMHFACVNGRLETCKWLYEAGAAEDIHTVDAYGQTPMITAAANGHLPILMWLTDIGATEDVSKIDIDGDSPLSSSFQYGYLAVCQWLILNGAIEEAPAPGADLSAVVEQVLRDMSPRPFDEEDENEVVPDRRPEMLSWARTVVATHDLFLNTFLRGTVVYTTNRPRCQLPRLPQVLLLKIGEFVGVVMGRRLRHVRNCAEALQDIIVTADNSAAVGDDEGRDDVIGCTVG